MRAKTANPKWDPRSLEAYVREQARQGKSVTFAQVIAAFHLSRDQIRRFAWRFPTSPIMRKIAATPDRAPLDPRIYGLEMSAADALMAFGNEIAI